MGPVGPIRPVILLSCIMVHASCIMHPVSYNLYPCTQYFTNPLIQ